MTIHSEWPRVFKAIAPEAHSQKLTKIPAAVFIDGQIKLMKQNDTREWRDFFNQQFLWPIHRYLKDGVPCVILAFDNYNKVPKAKQMTQSKRNTRNGELPAFSAGSDLPSTLPELWGEYMRNRSFKRKVIYEVINQLVNTGKRMNDDQLIIVDYEDTLYHIHSPQYTKSIPIIRTNIHGEADIKAPDYCRYFSSILIDAIDGDYIPISLIAKELHPETNISIKRIKIKKEGDPKASKREYEYVNIDILYKRLRKHMNATIRMPDSHYHHEMRVLATLIGCTGSDFTQGMSRVTPGAIIKNFKKLWPHAVTAYRANDTSEPLDISLFTNGVLSRLYKYIFPKHTEGANGMRSVYNSIMESSLSTATKRKVPDDETSRSMTRNINWLVLYWQPTAITAPEPIQDKYGFIISNSATSTVDWAKKPRQ
jgi:hypothetical protein